MRIPISEIFYVVGAGERIVLRWVVHRGGPLDAPALTSAPFEVLTDNGKEFTGKFTRPLPVEVLFERTCREYGITARLTKRRSPTTTGKIERFRQTLRRELLDEAGPFATIEAAQAAIDEWVHAYNTQRPRQSLDMAPRPVCSAHAT